MYHDVPGSVHNELFTVWDPEQGQTNTCKHKRFKLTRSLTCEIIDRDVKSIYMDCFIMEIPSDDRRALEFDFLMPPFSQFEVLCILIELVCCIVPFGAANYVFSWSTFLETLAMLCLLSWPDFLFHENITCMVKIEIHNETIYNFWDWWIDVSYLGTYGCNTPHIWFLLLSLVYRLLHLWCVIFLCSSD